MQCNAAPNGNGAAIRRTAPCRAGYDVKELERRAVAQLLLAKAEQSLSICADL